MPAPASTAEKLAPDPRMADFPPAETARYTRQMLESLKIIATRQQQHVLAGLLEAASREARRLIAEAF